jgi:hypothetical protein
LILAANRESRAKAPHDMELFRNHILYGIRQGTEEAVDILNSLNSTDYSEQDMLESIQELRLHKLETFLARADIA